MFIVLSNKYYVCIFTICFLKDLFLFFILLRLYVTILRVRLNVSNNLIQINMFKYKLHNIFRKYFPKYIYL